MKNVKNVILGMVFLFGMSSMNADSKLVIIKKDPLECYVEANAAEEAFCGSVDCNLAFWIGYYEGCRAS